MQVQAPVADRNWAMAAHLSALAAIAGLPFGHVVGPLVVYLIKARDSEFVAEHARASLNYQLTLSLGLIVAVIVGLGVTFGFLLPMRDASDTALGLSVTALWVSFGLLLLLVVLASLIFIIMGTIAAGEGRPYTYPFAIRFLR